MTGTCKRASLTCQTLGKSRLVRSRAWILLLLTDRRYVLMLLMPDLTTRVDPNLDQDKSMDTTRLPRLESNLWMANSN